jgi:hypothetical protein
MSKTDELIAKLEQELEKLKQIRLQEIEAAKPKPKLFDGPAMVGVRTFFELIENNAQEVNPDAYFEIREDGKYYNNAIFLGNHKDCPWELLEDGNCLILKVKEPEDSKETFEKFGITWKKHDGSENKPSELKEDDKIGFITKKEYNEVVPFRDNTFTVKYVDWDSDILGYYKK